MMIKQVCSECSLTKKAVEYYIEQGLLSPETTESGYRSFSREDADKLKRIGMLRRLGLSVAEIRRVSERADNSILAQTAQMRKLQLQGDLQRQSLLEQLAAGGSEEEILASLCALEAKQSVLERLLISFPGFYGRYMVLHFAPFLGEPAATKEQQAALRTITEFLDGFTLNLPPELEGFLGEITAGLDDISIEGMQEGLIAAAEDPQGYIDTNRDMLNEYLSYKASEEYRSSPAFALSEHMKKQYETCGYYDIFLPAMRKLSPAYNQYVQKLEQANSLFTQEYSAEQASFKQ